MIGFGSRLPSFRDEDRDLRGLWMSWFDGASCLFVSRAFKFVLQQLQIPFRAVCMALDRLMTCMIPKFWSAGCIYEALQVASELPSWHRASLAV